MKKTLLITAIFLALIVVILPVITACAKPTTAPAPAPTVTVTAPPVTVTTTASPAPTSTPAATAPATGKVLKIGMMTPSTGPAAEKGSPMGHANLDAFEYINNELGGVAGYKVEVSWFDTAYDAAKVATIVKKFMDDGNLLFGTASSKEGQAAMELANRAGFPGLVSFTAPSLYRPPQRIYGQMPDYGDDWLVFANYYMKNVWKGTGKPKMALHLLNNPTGYGARDAAKAKAEELGIEIISTDEHAATTTSEMESLTRIKAKNPDVIYISSTPAPTAVIIKNAKDLGLLPGVTIGLGHASLTKALVDIAGADVVEGVYGVFPTVTWGENVPGMAKMTEYVRKLHPKDEGNMDYITSWAQSLVAAEILRLAVTNAGYDTLAKGDASAWKAIETQGIAKLKDYKVGGLHGPVSYTPGDNRLSKSVRVFQIKKGAITPVTDWIDAPMVKYEDYPWFGK
ncbi:MAG: ABC transporter substrate-binding protein [Chloroflexi bacterium]|nr:ABC transporter substrate-binding protein [Chloroflexota bacterium]